MSGRNLTHEQRKRVIYALEFLDREHTLVTPEEVHHYAWHYNWDDGEASMHQLLDHPAIDKGTVLLIYWRASPRWFRQFATRDEVDDWARSAYDLIKEIEQRFATDFYMRQSIRYDPADDRESSHTDGYTDIEIKQDIPDEMYQITSGEAILWDELYDDLTDEELEQLEADIQADEE
jgi:hypothetical protein